MKKSVGTGILLLALVGAAAAHAQEQRRVGTTYAVRAGSRVEQILRQKSELKLTDAQVNQLEALRREDVTRRQNYMRDLIDLESRGAAGQLSPEEMRRQSRDLSNNAEDSAARLRAEVDRILTSEQHSQLEELRGARFGRVVRAVPQLRDSRLRRELDALPLERARAIPRVQVPRPPRIDVPRPARPPRPPLPAQEYLRRLPEAYRIPREHLIPELRELRERRDLTPEARERLRRRLEELRIRREGII
jgi:hypothetical protein